MTQLDTVFVKFCADALKQNREQFLKKVRIVIEVERSASTLRHLCEIGIDCVNREYDKATGIGFFKSNEDIMKWLRETAMKYISHDENVQRQFIEETSKIKEL